MKVKEEDNTYLIKFDKPYPYEGIEYSEINLAEIENLTGKDLADADKIFVSTGQYAAQNEMSVGYSFIIAHKVTKRPMEFFENLPAKEAIKLKNMVASFFYS